LLDIVLHSFFILILSQGMDTVLKHVAESYRTFSFMLRLWLAHLP